MGRATQRRHHLREWRRRTHRDEAIPEQPYLIAIEVHDRTAVPELAKMRVLRDSDDRPCALVDRLYEALSESILVRPESLCQRLADNDDTLGATAGDVTRLVLRDATQVVVYGAVVGIAGAAIGGRMLASQLYGVGWIDPMSLAATSAVLIAAAAIAAFLPARRAATIDPSQALRAD